MEHNVSEDDDFLGGMLSSSSFHGFEPEGLELGFVQETGKKMPRIDSVSVFREFLEHRSPARDPTAVSDAVMKPAMSEATSRISTVFLCQESSKNRPCGGLGASAEVDAEKSDNKPANSRALDFTQADDSSNGIEFPRYKDVIKADTDSTNREISFESSITIGGFLQENSLILPNEIEDPGKGRVSSTMQRTVEAINLGEGNVSGTLSPRFTGLQVESNSFRHQNLQEYEHLLKRKLDIACAAVALARSQGRSGSNSCHEQLKVGKAIPEVNEYVGELWSEERASAGPIGIPALPPKPKNRVSYSVMARMNTSGSSREQTDDEDAELELRGNEQDLVPGDIKRIQRMLSNRESARRSRMRKQAHLTDLDTQVAELKVENSSLSKQLNEITQKFNESLVDNRVLKADVKALTAKVRMAKDIFNRSRITRGTPALFNAELHQEQQLAGVKMGRTPSMQRIASLEHLQKRTRGGVVCSTLSWNSWDDAGRSRVGQGPFNGA